MLVEVVLVFTVSSLGAGLSGGLLTELELRVAVLLWVLFLVNCPALDVVAVVAEEDALTFFTFPRLDKGSSEMILDLGVYMDSMSMWS